MNILIERPRRAMAPVPRREVFRYVERARLPWWDGLRVLVALWIRRRAFRVIRVTERIERRAYARALMEG